MNKNNNLTQFNEGGLHSQNPNGGVMIGNNASVEQGETKNGNFIYSNRIVLDENTVSQYNLPKSLVGKSVADATKFIDNKFKGRNDKISQSTKDIMLSKIAEAQESMKPQEPEMEQQSLPEDVVDSNQMWDGGFMKYDTLNPNQGVGYQFGQTNNMSPQSIAQQDAGMDGEGPSPQAIIGAAGTALDLGRTAFGKPTQDTSGLQASAPVNTGGMITGSALKGASAGTAIMPGIGTAIGAGVGAIAGLLGSRKEKRAALQNSANFATRTNSQLSDNYAMGGPIDSSKGYHIMPDGTKMLNSEMNNQPINTVGQVIGINTTPDNSDLRFNTKNIVRYQPGVTSGKDGTSGFYLYSKLPTDQGFNVERDREFIKQQNMGAVQRTPQWQNYMKSQSIQPKQFVKGGPIDYLDVPLKANLELNPINRIYTGKTTDTTDLYNDKNYLNAANINDFKQPNITPVNIEQPTLGQKLKYEVGNTLGSAGKVLNENAGNLARYAPIAMNAYQLSQLKKPQGERLDRLGNRYKPEYVDEAQLQNIANQTMNNTVNAISQSGASEGQNRVSILGSQLQRTKALSDAYANAAAQNRATDDRAQTFNLGVDQVNLNQSNTERENYARDMGNYDTQKSRLLSQLGADVGNIGKEEIYKKIAKTTTGYSWLGEYQKMNPDATPEEVEKAAKKAGVLTDGTTKKALGGYLLKNKGK